MLRVFLLRFLPKFLLTYISFKIPFKIRNLSFGQILWEFVLGIPFKIRAYCLGKYFGLFFSKYFSRTTLIKNNENIAIKIEGIKVVVEKKIIYR